MTREELLALRRRLHPEDDEANYTDSDLRRWLKEGYEIMRKREKILAMEAGPEMDAAVAPMMGWTEPILVKGHCDATVVAMAFDPADMKRREVPHFSTDIAAAWPVVVKCGFGVLPHDHLEDGEWAGPPCAGTMDALMGIRPGPMATALEVPLAICRAAFLTTLANKAE